MKKYSLCLVFDENFKEKLFAYVRELCKDFDTTWVLDETSDPKVTVLKFKSDKDFDDFSGEMKITLAGLNLLPSKDGGTWIEVRVLENKEMLDLHEKFGNVEILNEIGKDFRPHITLCKLKGQKNINIFELNYDLLRKKDLKVKVVLKSIG